MVSGYKICDNIFFFFQAHPRWRLKPRYLQTLQQERHLTNLLRVLLILITVRGPLDQQEHTSERLKLVKNRVDPITFGTIPLNRLVNIFM